MEICNFMGTTLKELPVKNLRVPLISTRLKYSDCEDLKSRTLGKILSWHFKLFTCGKNSIDYSS